MFAGLRRSPAIDRRRAIVVLLSLLSACGVLGLWLSGDRLSCSGAADEHRERLIEAAGERYQFAGRLSGGFAHPSPSARDSNGTPQPRSDVQARLRSIHRDARAAAWQTSSASNLRTAGLASLLIGELDEAIRLLKSASDSPDSRSDSRSDLAVAYTARYERSAVLNDLFLALEAAQDATRESPQFAEATFNYATVLDALALHRRARAVWQRYLELDSTSAWAADARRRLASPETNEGARTWGEARVSFTESPDAVQALALVTSDAQAARELIEDDLMPAWAEAHVAGRAPDAARALAQAGPLAQALASVTGDGMTERVVRRASDDSRNKMHLALAHLAWRTARDAFAKNDTAGTAEYFRKAHALFTTARSPMTWWTRHYAIVDHYFHGRIAEGERAALTLLRDARGLDSKALRARAQWDLGSMYFQQARFGDAAAAYHEALATFEAIGERDNTASMYQSLAEAQGRLGLMDESWRAHRQALAFADRVKGHRRRLAIFTGAGYTALNAGLPRVASVFFLEASDVARSASDTAGAFEAEVGAGRSFAAWGDAKEAEARLRAAADLEASVINPSYKQRFGADLRLALADLASRDGRHSDVLTLTDEILERAQSVQSEYRLASLRLLRGRAARAFGRHAAAHDELSRGIEHLESKRALLQEEQQRISYLDTAWDLYAEMIDLQAFELAAPAEALRWANRGRARTLGEQFAASGSLASVGMPPLPAGHQATLFLAVTEHGLLAWVLSSTGITFKHLSPPEPVQSLIRRYYEVSTADAAATEQSLIDGYELIVRPFEAVLGSVATLTIVPDSMTQRIPFAALRDRRENRYLVERLALRTVPRLESRTPAPAASGMRRALAVFVDPLLQAASVPLPRLPGARAEAVRIAGFYGTSQRFDGAAATHVALGQALDRFDVVHVGVHATADSTRPGSMRLLLADDGPLAVPRQAGDLHRRVAGVVVLAACSTSRGPQSRGEVLMNLARPFLARGVADVVVTLADVPDAQTAELMTAFHRELARGLPVAEALARAQRAIIASGRSGSWWAAFTIVSSP